MVRFIYTEVISLVTCVRPCTLFVCNRLNGSAKWFQLIVGGGGGEWNHKSQVMKPNIDTSNKYVFHCVISNLQAHIQLLIILMSTNNMHKMASDL